MAQGLLPGTVSSDLHKWNLAGPVYDLATTVAKFMLLGWSLSEALEKVTVAPARAMGMLGEIGTLAPGACADIALFSVREEPRELVDALGEKRVSERWLEPVKTLRAGQVFEPL
jgi:dihydroorotase